MNTLLDLQNWYQAQCNEDWEHGNGITISTLDNPGWSLRVDLAETGLAECSFPEINRTEPASDWLVCRIREGKFEAYGGPQMLSEMIQTFLSWAGQHGEHHQPNHALQPTAGATSFRVQLQR